MQKLNNNTLALQALLTKVNNLPEGGSSGGGGSGGGGFEDNTDVCSVVYTSDYAFNTILYYGPDGYSIVGDSNNVTITAICGSVISVAQSGFYSVNVSAGEVICSRSGLGLVYRVPSTPTSVTINVTTD